MKIKVIATIFCVLIGFYTQASAQKNKQFTISGQLSGLPDGTKIYLTTQEKDTVARTISKGDSFTLKGKLPLNGRFHFIKIDTLVSKVATNAIFVINEYMTVSGGVGQQNVTVRGSVPQQDYIALLKEMSKFDSSKGEIGRALHKLTKEANEASARGDSIARANFQRKSDNCYKKLDSISQEENKLSLKWINSHPNSLLTPYILNAYLMILKPEKSQELYNNLALDVKESYYGGILKKELDNNKLSAKICEGNVIPNFDITGVNGDYTRIHEKAAKSKLTLIDFWASWCAPCRAAVPDLKRLFEVYKNKGFNIIGVSTDKNEVAWKNAVKEDGTLWFHGIDKNSASTQLFDMKAIPAYILIDNAGKIIAFDCAMSSIPNFGGSLRGENLGKKLKELLGK